MANKSQKPRKITYTKGRLYKVKLRGERQKSGLISLFLEYYMGFTVTPEGKNKIHKKYEYLGKHLKENPQNKEEREQNNEILDLAEKIRKRRESEWEHSKEGFTSPQKRKTNFIDYFQKFLDTYQNKDKRLVKHCFEYFKNYVGESYIAPSNINEAFVKGFKDHLLEHLNGETPYNYFTKFKKVCKQATKERILIYNYAAEVSITRPSGVKKEILSIDETQKLAKAECGNSEVKRAFLFCLNTGLRFVDVKGLAWKDVDLESRRLTKLQSKVKDKSTMAFVTIDLNNTAIKILGERGKASESIFVLPSLESCIKTVKNWAKRAKIDKNITWHSARHSFATNLLLNQSDIKTVSSLLGHSDLKHTQKYLHLVDEVKKKAVNTLPDLDF